MYELADKCDFTDRSTQIRDRLVVGILDERLSKEMQMMDEETLTEQKAVSMIRQAECVDIQSSELRAASRTENVHSVQGNSYAKKGNAEKPWKSSTKLTPRHLCRRCGNRSHPVQECPAKNAECFKCKNNGHFAKMCEAKMTNEVKVNYPNEVKVNEQQFLGEVTSNTIDSCCAVVAVMGSSAQVGDVFFKLDTCAKVSVIARKEPVLKRVKLVKSDKVLMGPGQATLDVLGQFTATISYKDVSTEEVLYVVDRQEHSLLSKGACERLKLLTFHVDSVSEYRAQNMIKLKDDASPVVLTVPRSVPYHLLPKVKTELDRMVEQGVISKVERPTDWCSGLIVVPTANKTDVRLCVNLTQLNKAASVKEQATSVKEQSISVKEQATSVKEQATSVKEQATSVKEQATSVKEQAASVKEQATSVKEQAASVKEQATSVKEQATSVKEQAASWKDQAASWKDQAASEKDQAASWKDQATSGKDRADSGNEQAPLANGYSPAQVLMGRQLRSTVPAHTDTLKPSIPDASHLRAKESIQRGYQKTAFDNRHRALQLPTLETGAQVWIKHAKRNGVVTGLAQTPQCYHVRTDGNTIIRRNRRSLVDQSREEPSSPPTSVSCETPVRERTTPRESPRVDIDNPPVTVRRSERRSRPPDVDSPPVTVRRSKRRSRPPDVDNPPVTVRRSERRSRPPIRLDR